MNTAYLRPNVQIIPDVRTVGELYLLAKDLKITTMPEWLQRLQQSKKWRADKCKKSKSYLYSFFHGNNFLTAFYVIKIDILLAHINQAVIYENDPDARKIYEDIKKSLEDKKSKGYLYVLLDGQNRLFEAIVNFFSGKLSNNKFEKPFVFELDGEEVVLQDFKFTDVDIDQRIKDALFKTQILLVEGINGDIPSFIQSVIDMNDGVAWSKFEGAIIHLSAINYMLNRDTFNCPITQNFFGNHSLSGNVSGMTGNYDVEKKGDARMLAELTYMLMHKCNNGSGTEKLLCDMLIESRGECISSYRKVKEYISFISSALTCMQNKNLKNEEKPICKEGLRSLILLLDMLCNRSNVYDDRVVFKVRDLKDIKTPKIFCEEFIKWHNQKTDRYSNPIDFDGKNSKPGTYVFNVANDAKDNLLMRMKFINEEFISDNYERWVSESCISNSTVDYRNLETLVKVKSGYKDVFSKSQPNIELRSKIHIDHLKPRKLGGTDDVNNLIPTNELSNKMKAAKY